MSVKRRLLKGKKSSDKIKMRFKIKDIRRIGRRFIDVLDRNKVYSNGDIIRLDGKKQIVDERLQDYMEFALTPLQDGSLAYRVSYIIPNAGIPLQTNVNMQHRHSHIILKSVDTIPGYSPFPFPYDSPDIFGNFPQSLDLETTDFADVRKKLEELASSR